MLSVLTILPLIATTGFSKVYQLRREVAPKPVYETLPEHLNTNRIVLKLKESMGRPQFDGQKFLESGPQWDRLNAAIAQTSRTAKIEKHFIMKETRLRQMRAAGSHRIGRQLPDLTLYYDISVAADATHDDKLT
ncbi:MAG: hypothetical protein AB1744_11780, partial [Candidatus Zixiibacteriota bacterium]